MPSQLLVQPDKSVDEEIIGFVQGQCDTVVLLITDLYQQKVVYICDTVESLFGYSPTLVLDQGYSLIRSVIHPSDSAELTQIYQHIFKSTATNIPVSWSRVFRIKDNRGHWVTVRGNFILRHQDSHEQHQLYISLKVLSLIKKEIAISRREHEVLKLIAQGLSTKQIADHLYISVHTAITHRKNLIEKFQVKNTAELIKEAAYRQWLE